MIYLAPLVTREYSARELVAAYLDQCYLWQEYTGRYGELSRVYDELIEDAPSISRGVHTATIVGSSKEVHPSTEFRFVLLTLLSTQNAKSLGLSKEQFNFLLNFVKENQ